MTPNHVDDLPSLSEWLKVVDPPRSDLRVLAVRAAMRPAPDFWNASVPVMIDTQYPWLAGMPLCRRLLTASVNASRANAGHPMLIAADDVLSAFHVNEYKKDRASLYSTAMASDAAADGRLEYVCGEYRWFSHEADLWTATRADLAAHLAGSRPLYALPLWLTPRNPYSAAWSDVVAGWTSAGSGWQFWIDWYDAVLDGRPLFGDWDRHWDLLTEIALIPDADWTAGPDRVNARIAELTAKHRLREEVDELRAENARLLQRDVGATPEHRAHNSPPELIEARAVREVEIAAFRAHVAVEAIANELRLSKPEPEKLEQSASQLSDALGSVLKWLGSKGDRAVDKLIDWGVPAGAIWLLSNQEKIAALISGVKNYLTLLGASG